MARRKPKSYHTGRTPRGHTRDVKIERIGSVTIYQRGSSYYLYFREDGKTQRQKVDGNLAVARASAARVVAALAELRPSPFSFERTTPEEFVTEYLDYIANVQKLAIRSQDRYRAALDRFLEFCEFHQVSAIDRFDLAQVEDLVRFLRGKTRTRNGHAHGPRKKYKLNGIKYILSVCKTAFNWARHRRMLAPYAENPFSQFSAERLRDPTADDEGKVVFSAQQQQAFFKALSDWQYGLFLVLACYGMRAGELANLLIEDVDFDANLFRIRSKPYLFWRVKTSRKRDLPLVGSLRELFLARIGSRKAGFVFLNEEFFSGQVTPAKRFENGESFRRHIESITAERLTNNPGATERELGRTVVAFARTMGQIPIKRLRTEFCGVTASIGCPQFTRTHDLRHLFSSRAQEAGVNPLLVQQLLGHATLNMTREYTHLGIAAKADGVRLLLDHISSTCQPKSEPSNG